eukprot:TRINITY_DN10676_c0_g1_i3.p2 TRINITY_DN10676_c0_g1~~TRINITY_DN10676_c0_g1_i3.p2  ORF type:complete len:104 (+),score=6.14 TRINITY_DN10676_c0_g1_i3:658-969(+)
MFAACTSQNQPLRTLPKRQLKTFLNELRDYIANVCRLKLCHYDLDKVRDLKLNTDASGFEAYSFKFKVASSKVGLGLQMQYWSKFTSCATAPREAARLLQASR